MDKAISFKNITGFYKDEGTGLVPVFLLHGFPFDNTLWDEFKKPLQESYRIITPDLPGFGKTPLPGDGLTMELMAGFIFAILEQENLDKVVLIGHSMGGYVALAFAEMYPRNVQGIGLFHSFAVADDDEKKATRLKAIEFIAKNGKEPFMKEMLGKLFADGFLETNPHVREELLNKSLQLPDESFKLAYRAMMERPDRIHILKNASFPVLFIYGKHDKTIPLDIAMKQANLPDESFVHIFPESGHMGMLEETERAQAAIFDYLDNL